jgi:hypothetical protein
MNIETHCSHGISYDKSCTACDAVWRAGRIEDLKRQAEKYGFTLAPTNPVQAAIALERGKSARLLAAGDRILALLSRRRERADGR